MCFPLTRSVHLYTIYNRYESKAEAHLTASLHHGSLSEQAYKSVVTEL